MSRRIVVRTASESVGQAVMTARRSSCTPGARAAIASSWIGVGDEGGWRRRAPASSGEFWCGFGSDWGEFGLMRTSRGGVVVRGRSRSDELHEPGESSERHACVAPLRELLYAFSRRQSRRASSRCACALTACRGQYIFCGCLSNQEL